MERRGLRTGQIVAAFGAAGLGLSLFAPWFGIEITEGGKTFAQGMMDRLLPGFHDFVAQGLSAFPGSVNGTGWQVFDTRDVVLALGAGLVLVLTFVAAGGFGVATADGASLAARLTAGAGVVAVGLIVQALASPPFTNGQRSISIGGTKLFEVHSRWGAWLGLASALAIAVGGLLARSAPRPAAVAMGMLGEEPDAGSPAPAWATQGSVAPPS
jgi:hypothetical protein